MGKGNSQDLARRQTVILTDKILLKELSVMHKTLLTMELISQRENIKVTGWEPSGGYLPFQD